MDISGINSTMQEMGDFNPGCAEAACILKRLAESRITFQGCADKLLQCILGLHYRHQLSLADGCNAAIEAAREFGIHALLDMTPLELRRVIAWAASDALDEINDSITGEKDFPDWGSDAGRPTKLVKQRCEACGKVFLIRYKAQIDGYTGVYIDNGYDYVGDACGCQSPFAPDDGEESIAEWVADLNAEKQRKEKKGRSVMKEHAILLEMELDESPTAGEVCAILNLFDQAEHLLPVDAAANNSYAVGFIPDSLANLLDYDLRDYKQAIAGLIGDEALLMAVAAAKDLPNGAKYEVVVRDIPTYIFRNIPNVEKE